MFIVLGIEAGGAEATAQGLSVTVNFKSASTGLVTFVVGSALATIGGVLPNDYTTAPIPSFAIANSTSTDKTSANDQAIAAFRDCKLKYQEESKFQNCFADIFRQLNDGALR
jgi:hypothetical protein